MEPLTTATLRLGSAKATRAFGARLAELLRPGDFVGLAGDLGAGKTLLSRAICEALGVPPGHIASPTFAIVHPYDGGRLPVQHADLYRVSSHDELYATGFLDLVEGGDVMLVEWIDRVPEAAPPEWLRIELVHVGPRSRKAIVQGYGKRGAELAAALAE
ncbi:MAG TPA: tRNA (adenosine(37)-N6)-threonylcarbamoyltransferase complex ATPase subunit type 1 TsaE [Vulgatibacter sp.]